MQSVGFKSHTYFGSQPLSVWSTLASHHHVTNLHYEEQWTRVLVSDSVSVVPSVHQSQPTALWESYKQKPLLKVVIWHLGYHLPEAISDKTKSSKPNEILCDSVSKYPNRNMRKKTSRPFMSYEKKSTQAGSEWKTSCFTLMVLLWGV